MRKLQLSKSFRTPIPNIIPTEPETAIPNTHRVQNSNTQYPPIPIDWGHYAADFPPDIPPVTTVVQGRDSLEKVNPF